MENTKSTWSICSQFQGAGAAAAGVEAEAGVVAEAQADEGEQFQVGSKENIIKCFIL